MAELSILPNVNHAETFFKKTYLDAKEIWLYEYQFDCPIILERLNTVTHPHLFKDYYSGFVITIAVRCNKLKEHSTRNNAVITCTLEIVRKTGHRIALISNVNDYYSPRANYELFADSLFRIALIPLTRIFRDVDSIYEYLNSTDRFRGYHLAYN